MHPKLVSTYLDHRQHRQEKWLYFGRTVTGCVHRLSDALCECVGGLLAHGRGVDEFQSVMSLQWASRVTTMGISTPISHFQGLLARQMICWKSSTTNNDIIPCSMCLSVHTHGRPSTQPGCFAHSPSTRQMAVDIDVTSTSNIVNLTSWPSLITFLAYSSF